MRPSCYHRAMSEPTHLAATASAPSNIAFLKYWGNVNEGLRLPYNPSLSMNLDAATTTTTVRFDPGLNVDSLSIDDEARRGAALTRVGQHLDHIRARADISHRAHVRSHNTFPMGTGIASSASAFAALTVAATAAAGLPLDEKVQSAIARRGSGSAARSVPDGFVAWRAAARSEDSFAESIHPPDHWDLRDLVAVVSHAHKEVGSGGGHALAAASPFFAARQRHLLGRYLAMRDALAARDLAALGPLIEAEALELHAIAMTSRPPVLYWDGATVALLNATRRWRDEGLAVYFTLDAGPNVHLLCEAHDADDLERALQARGDVERVLHNRPAYGARLVAPSAAA